MGQELVQKIEEVSIAVKPLSGLANSWQILTPSTALMVTGILDTSIKVESLLQQAKQLHIEWKKLNPDLKLPFRVTSLHLGLQKDEWNDVTAQYILITWSRHQPNFFGQCCMLSLPTEHFYTPKNAPLESESSLKAAAEFPLLQNSETWMTYCFWLNEKIEKTREGIPLESLDSYTLEAYLKSFTHEIQSILLQTLETDFEKDVLKLGSFRGLIDFPCEKSEEMMDLEKKLANAQLQFQKNLQIQCGLLLKIIEIIQIIETAHPEFVSLKIEASLLGTLSSEQDEGSRRPISWIQTLICLQLLHEELEVMTVINCSIGSDRSNLALAVMLAASIFKKKTSVKTLIDLLMHWDKTEKAVNFHSTLHNLEDFHHWVNSTGSNEKETTLKTHVKFLLKFKNLILEILKKLCLPIIESAGPVQDLKWHESQKIDSRFLDLLPPYGEITNESGNSITTRLVYFDNQGHPIDLTKAGHFLMTKLCRKQAF
jgi:hypothetical protein